ncbi:MAG: PRC-barrel domain-containing protein [Hyphomicrobiales bacterium]
MSRFLVRALGAALLVASPSAAFAACNIGNADQAEQKLSKVEGIYSGDYGALRRDMRQLRTTAYTLQKYGQDQACQQVVDSINQLLQDPKKSLQAASNGAATNMSTDTTATTGTATGTAVGSSTTNSTAMNNTATDQTGSIGTAGSSSMEERRASAVPLTQSKQMSANDIIGSDVYGTDNRAIGEVEDIVVGANNEPGYAVVSYGGFLGIGKDLAAVPMSAIKVSRDNYLFVDFDRARLEAAPKVKRGNNSWWANSDWRRQNDAYYMTSSNNTNSTTGTGTNSSTTNQ